MKILQAIKVKGAAFRFITDQLKLNNPLVFVFGNRYALEENGLFEEVRKLFPNGHV
ncbi:hypothetical protein LCGC14_1987390, partial [marine sediment metagenome]